ncbi:MAG: hypothetical protein LBB23_04420 [Rickettsiales bacterium]|nr:hypothetical protein [Rickettsiales bacterium]
MTKNIRTIFHPAASFPFTTLRNGRETYGHPAHRALPFLGIERNAAPLRLS